MTELLFGISHKKRDLVFLRIYILIIFLNSLGASCSYSDDEDVIVESERYV
jgi:hypothetical protein